MLFHIVTSPGRGRRTNKCIINRQPYAHAVATRRIMISKDVAGEDKRERRGW
jgi:hypothetical protein